MRTNVGQYYLRPDGNETPILESDKARHHYIDDEVTWWCFHTHYVVPSKSDNLF